MTIGSGSSSTSFLIRNFNQNQDLRNRGQEKLGSGLRINRAADDAAGLEIAEALTAEIKGLGAAQRNTQDFVSLTQIADGASGQISDQLARLKELAVQSGNGTLSDTDRQSLNNEFSQITQEISRIVDTTQFNGVKVLSGGNTLTAQIGTDSSSGSQLSVTGLDLTSLSSSLSSLDIGSQSNALAALQQIDDAGQSLSNQRSTIGGFQSRLDAVSTSISSRSINQQAARSRITDADFADVLSEVTRRNILAQPQAALIAQAGQLNKDNIKALLG